MANRRREPGFYGTTTETAEYNTVFVDTSLDTHLAMLVCKSDTVSDFKKKIALEHMHCFPKIEDLHIHSLKVKRKASFYHLPDSMLVWSALYSAKGNWFLSVDASSSSTTQQTIPISLEKTTDIQNNNFSGNKKTPAKKKCKRSHTELGQDVRADQSGAVPFKVPDISAGLMDAPETAVKIQDTDMSTGKKKRKRKKSKKPANNVASEKREPAEENQHSSGNGHADVPVVEKAKDSETTDNTNKNAKEEINMKMITTADVQEDLPSSQVPARQSEEKLEEKQEIAVKTDDLATATEEINFREYFVPSAVKNANQSSMEMKSMKKVKTNGLPSVSISTEVQSSSKLSADHKSENKSHVRKDSGERQGDSGRNSDSSRRSSRFLEKGVKESSTSERLETNLPKPKEIIAESSIPKKKNASVVKSSLEKLPGKSGNRMEFKSVLSGDENGTAHSNGSTRSPSDSSSMSDQSMSESALSQDSTRNGSSAAGKGRSKLDILLDSGVEITMEQILRSSKRFKKAKLIALQNEANEAALQNEANEAVQNESQPIEANEAVQNESQPIEFVPDSLP